jgi:hypothetical protein
MPQTLNEQWKLMLGEDFASVHTKYLDTFGSLTLTAYNSELGNLQFEQKREQLSKSHVELNLWIVEQCIWREAQMTERATVLAKRAIVIWPRELSMG